MNAKKIFFAIIAIVCLITAVIWVYKNHNSRTDTRRYEAAKNLYYCPMHPDYTSDKPGSCPICGMDLVKQETAKDEEETNIKGTVSIDTEKQRLIGVKTGKAVKKEFVLKIISPGKIAYDPDLYHAISEYREAVATSEKTKNSPWPEVRERSEMLVNSAGLKLRQMGISDEQIKDITNSNNNYTSLLLPQENKNAWAYIQIYEYEIGLIKPGQAVEITAPAYPGRKFKGTIKSVDSIISPETRTLRARAETENPGGLLKPEMYVDAEISVNLGKKLLIPADSVLDTGKKRIIFIDKGSGKFEPRDIQTGKSNGEYVEVLNGLKEGEKIVVSSNFLIDSESKLKSALER